MINLRSDNEVGAHPKIIEAVSRAFSSGSAFSYGADEWTQRVENRLRDIFDKPDLVAYPVGVGKAGKTWSGLAYISGKFIKPAWSPPADVRRDKPSLPDRLLWALSSPPPLGMARMRQRTPAQGSQHRQEHGTSAISAISSCPYLRTPVCRLKELCR